MLFWTGSVFLIQEKDVSSVFKLKLSKIFMVSKSVTSAVTPREKVYNFISSTRSEVWISDWCESTVIKEPCTRSTTWIFDGNFEGTERNYKSPFNVAWNTRTFVFCRNLLMVVHFTDINYANNTFSLCQLSPPNTLSSVLLENEGIPVVKVIVHPNV